MVIRATSVPYSQPKRSCLRVYHWFECHQVDHSSPSHTPFFSRLLPLIESPSQPIFQPVLLVGRFMAGYYVLPWLFRQCNTSRAHGLEAIVRHARIFLLHCKSIDIKYFWLISKQLHFHTEACGDGKAIWIYSICSSPVFLPRKSGFGVKPGC